MGTAPHCEHALRRPLDPDLVRGLGITRLTLMSISVSRPSSPGCDFQAGVRELRWAIREPLLDPQPRHARMGGRLREVQSGYLSGHWWRDCCQTSRGACAE